MSNGSAIKAGRAYVEMFLDDNPLARGLNLAAAKLKAWGSAVSALGQKVFAAGLLLHAPFELAAKVFTDMGSELAGMANRTGVSVEQLSALGFAAQQSGVDMESLEHGLRHMQKAIAAAAGGGKEAQEAFDELRVSVNDLSADNAALQLGHLADAFSKIGNPTQKAALAMKVFGREGTGLIPLLNKGAAGIDELIDKAMSLGLIMSSEDAQAAAAFKHELAGLWAQLKMVAFHVGAAVVPAMRDFLATAQPVIGQVIEWAREHRGLIAVAAKLATAVVAGGAGVMVLGRAVAFAGGAFRLLGAGAGFTTYGLRLVFGAGRLAYGALEGIGRAALFVLNPLKLARAAMAAFHTASAGGSALSGAAKLLANPYVLLGAAVVGVGVGLGVLAVKSGAAGRAVDWLGEQFPGLGAAGRQALDYLGTKWDQLKETALTTWGGISDALAGGDLAGAASIAWLGIKVAWMEGTQELMQLWDTAVAYVESAWADASAWLQTQFVTVEIYWSELTGFLGEEWDRLVGWLTEAWEEWGPTVVAVADAVWQPIKGVWDEMKGAWGTMVAWMADVWDKWSDRIIAALKPILTALSYVNPAAAAALGAIDALANSDTSKNLQAHLGAAAERAAGPEAQAENDAIEAGRQKRQGEIEAERQGAPGRRQGELDAAKAALAEAVGKAAEARASAGLLKVGGPAVPSPMSIQAKADVAGTFSASAAGRLGFGESLTQRMANGIDQIAENTAAIAASVAGIGALG